MWIFFHRSIFVVLFTFLFVFFESANAKPNASTDGFNNEKTASDSDSGVNNVSQKTLEQARSTLSQLSPEARRFLFSPTIQNTITNLNQNTNTHEVRNKIGHSGSGEKRSSQMLGYLDKGSDTVEYDLKGKVNKICFILK